jgi:hypothetical protein
MTEGTRISSLKDRVSAHRERLFSPYWIRGKDGVSHRATVPTACFTGFNYYGMGLMSMMLEVCIRSFVVPWSRRKVVKCALEQ